MDIILVMQCSPLNCHSADVYGFEDSERIESPRPAHIDPDIEQAGGSLDGGEFICDGPARVVPDVAKLLLQRNGVHLNDDSVGVVR